MPNLVALLKAEPAAKENTSLEGNCSFCPDILVTCYRL